MTKTEYVARVIYFYSKNKPRVGYLTFDKKKDGFGIVEGGSLLSKTIPEDGLHCGDTYILTDNEGKWRIGQCKLVEGIWKILGTDITEKTCNNNLILYVREKTLNDKFFVDEHYGEELSDWLVSRLVGR